VVPPGQTFWHEPPVQLAPGAQAFPQAPQLFGSVFSSTHAPLHSVVPLGQVH
jgi:hypothetical protein